MSEIKNDPRLKQAAEEAIAKAVDRRVISFTLDGETYWIKRKMGNGRKQFVKYSVEKEFYFEVAKMTIAGRAGACAGDPGADAGLYGDKGRRAHTEELARYRHAGRR